MTATRLHRCTICGRVGSWGPTWEWWGSAKDLDEGRPVVKICSSACRNGLSAAHLARLGRQVRSDPHFVLRSA
jgi:hypothetical protein